MIEENQIVEVFTLVDDFILGLNKEQSKLTPSKRKRGFPPGLSESEVITICLLFQFSGFRNFKAFYTGENAYIESWFSSLKKEFLYRKSYTGERELRWLVFEYIEVWYNKKRRHSSLDYQSPKGYAIKHNLP